MPLPQLGQELGLPGGLYALGALGLVGVALLVGFAVWALATVARGALIAGARDVAAEKTSSFAEAFRAGWKKGWTLIGIGLLPALPGVLLALLGAGAGAAGYLGLARANVGRFPALPNALLAGGLASVACLLIPLALVLSLLRTFANRASMLEGCGVWAAYRRGTQVLLANLGPALILFGLQVAVSVALGILLLLPTVVLALCCLVWPVLLLVQGAMAAFFSTLWTLAWQEWTGR
jgi:hypothetical protein